MNRTLCQKCGGAADKDELETSIRSRGTVDSLAVMPAGRCDIRSIILGAPSSVLDNIPQPAEAIEQA